MEDVHTLATQEKSRDSPSLRSCCQAASQPLLYTKLKALKNNRKSESKKALCSFLFSSFLLLFLPVKEGVVSSLVRKDGLQRNTSSVRVCSCLTCGEVCTQDVIRDDR